MHELANKELVERLLSLDYKLESTCDACIKNKQARSPFMKLKKIVSSTPCELLHLDICGLMRTKSIKGKSYILVTIHEFSRFS